MTAGPHLGGLDPADLTASYGSPLHVVDAEALDTNATAALGPLRTSGEGADVYYSYKTNPVPGVLRRLHDHGIGAEVISAYELWLALRLGVAPARIIYNGPAKSFASLCQAAEVGLGLVNANSRGDMSAMARAAAVVGQPMRSGLRVAMPHMWGGQFGIPATSDEVAETVADARSSQHLDLIGLHFHSGRVLRDRAAVDLHVRKVLSFCDRLRRLTGWHPGVIDMGGSLACATVFPLDVPGARSGDPGPETVSIAEASALWHGVLTEHFASLGLSTPLLVIEPGRALTASSQLLLTTVVDVRTVESGSRVTVVDAGSELAEPVQSERHLMYNLTRPDAAVCAHDLVGPDVDLGDVLVRSIDLPRSEPGDVLAIMDTGAYFVSFSTASYRPRPAIILREGVDISVIRRREDTADLTWREVR